MKTTTRHALSVLILLLAVTALPAQAQKGSRGGLPDYIKKGIARQIMQWSIRRAAERAVQQAEQAAVRGQLQIRPTVAPPAPLRGAGDASAGRGAGGGGGGRGGDSAAPPRGSPPPNQGPPRRGAGGGGKGDSGGGRGDDRSGRGGGQQLYDPPIKLLPKPPEGGAPCKEPGCNGVLGDQRRWEWQPPKFDDSERGRGQARQNAKESGELRGTGRCDTCGVRGETGQVIRGALSHRQMGHEVTRTQGNHLRGQNSEDSPR